MDPKPARFGISKGGGIFYPDYMQYRTMTTVSWRDSISCARLSYVHFPPCSSFCRSFIRSHHTTLRYQVTRPQSTRQVERAFCIWFGRGT